MQKKYLKHFPEPLLRDLLSSRWLPVVGAGLSLNAILPPGEKMPLWKDLADALSGDHEGFSPNSILDAISAYQHEFGRTKLVERLFEILHVHDAQPGRVHRAFCQIPFGLVCTTNFDFLLDTQYQLLRTKFHPIVQEDQLSVNVTEGGTALLKLHGDLRHPTQLVVTESDYDSFLNNNPLVSTYLANQLITKTAVLVGYSLDDPDFRQIWHVVSSRLGKQRRNAYAILVAAQPSDIARFDRRGVKVINLPGAKSKYADILTELFEEIRDYYLENFPKITKVTEEKPRVQLLLPRDAVSRLCFFSLPLDSVSSYREYIFPIVENVGFVPITADDVIAPGDSATAKIATLIDRAALVVIEVSTEWTRAEFDMAVSRVRNSDRASKKLYIVVIGTDQSPSYAADDVYFIRRPEVLSDEDDYFAKRLEEVLRGIAIELGVLGNLNAELPGDIRFEAERLFGVGEYRAAVISAMTSLEAALRNSLEKKKWEEVRRPASMRQLLDQAINENLLDPNDKEYTLLWARKRNEAVHSAKPITRQEARMVLSGVTRLLDRLMRRQ